MTLLSTYFKTRKGLEVMYTYNWDSYEQACIHHEYTNKQLLIYYSLYI